MLFSTISKHSYSSDKAPGTISVMLPSRPAALTLSHTHPTNGGFASLPYWVPFPQEPVFSSLFAVSHFVAAYPLVAFQEVQ